MRFCQLLALEAPWFGNADDTQFVRVLEGVLGVTDAATSGPNDDEGDRLRHTKLHFKADEIAKRE